MAMRRHDPYKDPDPDKMKWVTYYKGFSKVPLKEFLKKKSPSIVRKDEGFGWISVSNWKKHHVINNEMMEKTAEREEIYDTSDTDCSENTDDTTDTYDSDDSEDTDDDTVKLLKSWEKHKEENLPVNYETIKGLALKHNTTVGKWILFTEQGGKVDNLWSLIAKCVVADDNPCVSAKVSTFVEDMNHVICIYNKDFTNLDEVLESENAIRKMGIKCQLQYKPDVYSYLFIYAKNKWNLKPYIMTSQFNLLTNSSIIEHFT